MHVALVFPPFSIEGWSCPPTIVATTAAQLRRLAGHEILSLDMNIDFINRWLNPAVPPPPIFDYDPYRGTLSLSGPEYQLASFEIEAYWNRLREPVADQADSNAVHVATKHINHYAQAIFSAYAGLIGQIAENRRVLDDALCRDMFPAESALFAQEKTDRPALYVQLLTDYLQVGFALASARLVREKFGCPTVLAGPELMMGVRGRDVIEATNYVDYVILGEAEAALPALVEALSPDPLSPDPTRLGTVPGLVWRDAKGQVRTEAADGVDGRATLADPSTLPIPDFAGFSLGNYLGPVPTLMVPVSYGQRYDNSVTHTMPLPFREIPPATVLETLKRLHEAHSVRDFCLTGQVTTAWLNDFIEEIERQKAHGLPDFRFGLEALFLSPDALAVGFSERMRAAGIRNLIVWGLGERADDDLVTIEEVALFATQAIVDASIHTVIMYVLGWPTQSLDQFGDEIDALRMLPFFPVQFGAVDGKSAVLDPKKFGVGIEKPFVALSVWHSRSEVDIRLIRHAKSYYTHPQYPIQWGGILSGTMGFVQREYRSSLSACHTLALADTPYFSAVPAEPTGPQSAGPPMKRRDASASTFRADIPPLRWQFLEALHLLESRRADALKLFEAVWHELQNPPARGKRRDPQLVEQEKDIFALLIGIAHANQREFDTACRWFGRIRRQSPLYALGRRWMAHALIGKQDVQAAFKPMGDALDAGLEVTDFILLLVFSKESRGLDSRAALQLTEMALHFHPELPQLEAVAKKLSEQLGDMAASRRYAAAERRKKESREALDKLVEERFKILQRAMGSAFKMPAGLGAPDNAESDA